MKKKIESHLKLKDDIILNFSLGSTKSKITKNKNAEMVKCLI